MSEEYTLLHLAAKGSSWADLAQGLRAETNGTSVERAWQERGARVWGMFAGLFGLDSNELFVILHNPAQASPVALAKPVNSAHVMRAVRLRPTARPTAFLPLSKNGLYVFRTFRLKPGSVETTVRLSRQAWETFEADRSYQATPLGLFEEIGPEVNNDENMLLLTWYDGFESWELSRQPHPEAADNFRQRHALTTRSGAIATRLLMPGV
jgi:hypothetical protein